jgi:eukaryotic-like serine/threonine-protein kinase
VRFQILPPANTNFADLTFRLSPDGRNLAYVAAASDEVRRLWVHSLETGEARMLEAAGVPNLAQVAWSPDGRFLAFTAEGKIKRIASNGGSLQTLVDAPGGANDWSRDDVLLFAEDFVVKRMPASGGTVTPLTALDMGRHELAHYLPRLLPDGRHFVYLRRSLAEETSGVFIGSIDARPEEQDLTRLVANAAMAVYAPGPEDPRIGHLLFNRGRTLLAQRFDAGALRLEGDEFPVAERVALVNNPSHAAFFSASGNGVLVYREAELSAGTPVWVNRAGVEVAALVQSPLPGLEQLRLSPDGTRLAGIVHGDVWVYDLGGRPPIKLTSGGGIDTPVWSPDGQEIIYSSNQPSFRLFSVPVAVGSTPAPVSPLGHYHAHGWSPDGRDVIAVLNSYSPSGWDILKVPWRRDVPPEPFVKTSSDDGMFGATLSPDGRWLAYTLNATGNHEVWVRPYAGSAPPVRVSAHGGVDPQWARDGTELYFLENLMRMMVVAIKPGAAFDFTPPRPLFELPFPTASVFPNLSYDVAADGKFMMVRPAPPPASPTPITVVLNWASALTN